MTIYRHNLRYIAFGAVAVIFLCGLLLPNTATHAACTDNIGLCIPNELEGIVYNITVGFGGIMLWAGGGLLDYSVQYLVVGMGEYLNGAIGQSIDKLWVLVRDVFNILFIFGIIYIGFRTILKSDDNTAKKALGWLIVAALMINFSLFITKAIVDVANATSYQIYTAMQGEGRTDGGGYVLTGGATRISSGVTDQFMDVFRLTTFAGDDIVERYQDNTLLGGRLLFFGVLMMIVMLIAAFVFAAGAFMMIGRFVMIIIFMILSPVMFLGLVFPLFKKYQDVWWDKFLQQAFVGPAYLFMLYLSLWVISGLAITDFGFAQAFSANSYMEGSFAVFLNFGIVAAFLIASLVVAQKLGGYGATASLGMMKAAGNRVRYGTQSFVGRNTVGRLSRYAGIGYDKYDKYMSKTRGRRLLRGAANLGANVATAGLYGAAVNRRNIQGITNAGANAKFGGSYSRNDDVKYNEQRANMPDTVEKEEREAQVKKNKKEEAAANAKAFKAQSKAFSNRRISLDGPKGLTETLKARGDTIKSMTNEQLANLGIDELKKPETAMFVTDEHLKFFEDNGYYSKGDTAKIKDARKEAQEHIAKNGTVNFSGGIGIHSNAQGSDPHHTAHHAKMRKMLLDGKSIRDIGKMPIELFKKPEMYSIITPQMVEERMRNGVNRDDTIAMRNAFTEKRGSVTAPENKQWAKWQDGNSVYASQFFTTT